MSYFLITSNAEINSVYSIFLNNVSKVKNPEFFFFIEKETTFYHLSSKISLETNTDGTNLKKKMCLPENLFRHSYGKSAVLKVLHTQQNNGVF